MISKEFEVVDKVHTAVVTRGSKADQTHRLEATRKLPSDSKC
jgi:hypothetical protein